MQRNHVGRIDFLECLDGISNVFLITGCDVGHNLQPVVTVLSSREGTLAPLELFRDFVAIDLRQTGLRHDGRTIAAM